MKYFALCSLLSFALTLQGTEENNQPVPTTNLTRSYFYLIEHTLEKPDSIISTEITDNTSPEMISLKNHMQLNNPACHTVFIAIAPTIPSSKTSAICKCLHLQAQIKEKQTLIDYTRNNNFKQKLQSDIDRLKEEQQSIINM